MNATDCIFNFYLFIYLFIFAFSIFKKFPLASLRGDVILFKAPAVLYSSVITVFSW